MTVASYGQYSDLFISMYAEGSSSNKFIEIYNGTGSSIDLSNYMIKGTNNGGDWKEARNLNLTGSITDGDVYVIAADQADASILAVADLSLSYESALHYNGDDAIALLKKNDSDTFEVIDIIGATGDDPGSGWAVAGVTNATKDHTLTRKNTISGPSSDWTSSAGTDESSSEWVVTGKDTEWTSLGSYTPSSTSTTVVLQDFTNLTNTATADVYGGFGGGLTATNAVVDDPTDASNKVRTVTTTAGGDVWKGVFFRPQTHYIDLTSTKTVSVKIYSTTASYFKGKIQAGQDNQADIELATSESHGGTGWETLTFTFSDATGEYGEFVIFTNPDANGAFIDPATEVLEAHFDDITADQGSEIPAPPSGPTDSPTAPTADAADVVSIYSDAYTDITTNYNPGWGQAGNVNTTYDPGDGNNVMVYSNFNYQGTVVPNTDISAMEKLHIDIWVADASVRTIKVSPILVSGSPAEFLVTVPVTSGAWNSVDIALSDFTGLTFGEIKEIKFDGQFKADGTGDGAVRSDVYLDNIYFYKEPTPSTTVVLQDFTNLTNIATADVYGGFGGGLTATNAVVDDPTDASNKVRTVTTTAGGDVWKGVFFRPQTHYIDLTSTKTVSVKIYSTTASYFKGKIQAGQDNQADIELATSESHGGTGWETLTFTFSDATGEYGEFVIFTNPDANGAFIDPATEVLEAHFDDITADQGSEIPAPPSGPTDSPTAPTADAADVVSIYSDAYTDITTNYNPGWGQAGNVNTTYDPGDGNNVMVYSNFNYQGTVVPNTDISAMEKLHIDIWVADASVRTIKVSPILVSGSPAEFLVTVPVTSGAWNSVDIALSDFTGLTFGEIKEIKFDGQFAADGTTADIRVRSDVSLDNIYFYKESTASTIDNALLNISMYPNPASSRLTISAQKTIHSAAIYNILGKQVMSLEINKNSESIDVSNLATGMYLIKYSIDNAVGTAKFIKQ